MGDEGRAPGVGRSRGGYSRAVAAPRHQLLVGTPGVGKTTVLRRLARRFGEHRVGGFVTEELRGEDGRRRGFRAVTLAGETWTISHVDFPGAVRVGRYGVDLAAVDRLGEVVERAIEERVDLFLLDEIGKMECLSRRFVEAARRLLDTGILTVATVAARGGGFIAEVKRRPDVEPWQVTVANRADLPSRLAGRLSEWLRVTG